VKREKNPFVHVWGCGDFAIWEGRFLVLFFRELSFRELSRLIIVPKIVTDEWIFLFRETIHVYAMWLDAHLDGRGGERGTKNLSLSLVY
jgi:hypothetical protein